MDEVYVAIMGVTGSGKSTFIQQATGDQSCRIGKKLESETQEVREHRCRHGGQTYVLIDTPGFDDSYRSSDEIVGSILTWLKNSYQAQKLLSGIIYFHRISDVRMQGSAFDNLRMFRKLCGVGALKNVLLVTTFWDAVSEAEGHRREQELLSNDQFWGRMIKGGSKMKRWSQHSHDGATKDILNAVIPGAKRALQAQIEMVDQGKPKNETDVARATYKTMRIEINAQFAREKERMKKDMHREQQKAREQHERERLRLRKAAEQQLQMEHDARKTADEEEYQLNALKQRVEVERMRSRILRRQAEKGRAKIILKEEKLKRKALQLYYANHRCTHDEAEKWYRCDKCGVKVHRKRTHYYREFEPLWS